MHTGTNKGSIWLLKWLGSGPNPSREKAMERETISKGKPNRFV